MNQKIYSETDSNHEYLYEIAKYQRKVLLCILVRIGVFTAYRVAPDKYALAIELLGIAVTIGFVFYIYQLAKRLYSSGMAVFFCIVIFVPYLGFIALLNVNYSATKTIQAKGYDVGFMGANLNQFRNQSG